MPNEVGIWKINEGVKKITFSPFDYEKKLEEIFCSDLSILDPGLLLIGNQVGTAYGKSLDILAINMEGDIIVIELKRNRTPREVVAQLLDYASWVDDLSVDEIKSILHKNGGLNLEYAFIMKFKTEFPERINETHRLIVIASELDNQY